MKRIKNLTPKLHIRKGDNVRVIAGEYKGQEGKVLEVFQHQRKALVEQVNLISRHTKPNTQNTDGGIVKKEAPVHVSNLMLLDPKSGEATRVGRQRDSKGRWVRYAKKSGEVIK